MDREHAGAIALRDLLDEQVRYYRACAGEYCDHALPDVSTAASELVAAIDAFRPAGSVLEIACGPGTWTAELLRHASSLTALDAAPEMLAVAAANVRDGRVRFVQADVFEWTPDQLYDVVFFGFWLSHVPIERFDPFWSTVERSLVAHGRVFFVDDGYRTAGELIEDESSETIRRRLNDGSEYRIVKVPHEPADLQRRLAALGWDITVTQTSGPFFWGSGRSRSAHRSYQR